MNPIWESKDAGRLNEEFLAAHENDLPYVLQAGRMLAQMDPSQSQSATSLITCLEEYVKNRTLEVCLSV